LADVGSGIADDRILKVDVSLTGTAYETEEARDGYATRVLDALQVQASVAAAARVGNLLEWRTHAGSWVDTIYTDASPAPLSRRLVFRTSESVVSANYFAATGLPLIAGQTFDAGLAAGGEPVAVLAAET